MVELGDLREGIMPKGLEATVRCALRFPHIDLRGIGVNLGCFNGVAPDDRNMRDLSRMADHLDQTFCAFTDSITRVVSGGNSSNLQWAFGGNPKGRIKNLRLAMSILLGVDPLRHAPIEGLFTDAVTLLAEVIEGKMKPTVPWGELAHATFERSGKSEDRGTAPQIILAIGQQDIDLTGRLVPLGHIQLLGTSSDHLIVTTNGPLANQGPRSPSS